MSTSRYFCMPSCRRSCLTLAILSLALVAARTAGAAPIVYGDKFGTNVDYLGVQEESATDPGPVGLFGAPIVTGDKIDFNPQAFAASSTGLASDTTDSNLQFTIMAHAGKAINNVTFTEAGDTTLTGLQGEAQTTVATTLIMEITQVRVGNTLTAVNLNVPVSSMTFSPTNDFLRSIQGSGTKAWTGSLSVNLGPTLAANNINGVATKVFVSLDNTLTAASVLGTSAFIQKKDADGLVIIVNIPEPASAASALIALVLGGGMFRRRGA